MLLIIDNQSSFIKKFKHNFLSEQNIEYELISKVVFSEIIES